MGESRVFKLFFTGVGILTFASLVYICESEMGDKVAVEWKNKTIYVPHNDTWTFGTCFWWGVMTITTVGYDSNPTVLIMLPYYS